MRDKENVYPENDQVKEIAQMSPQAEPEKIFAGLGRKPEGKGLS